MSTNAIPRLHVTPPATVVPSLSLLQSQHTKKIKLLFTLLCASTFQSIRSTPSHTDHCLRESEQLTYWSPHIRVTRTQHPSSFLTDISNLKKFHRCLVSP